MTDILPPPPKRPAAPAPRRPAGSVRRTSTIDISWPAGRGTPMHAVARARDLLTTGSGESSLVLAEGGYEADLSLERSLLAIGPAEELAPLIGERAGSHLRAAIARVLPEEKAGGTPLYLILDDLAGASLVSPWAWSRWDPSWSEQMLALKADPNFASAFNRENICTGLRTGSSGLGFMAEGVDTAVLVDPADEEGWHELPAIEGPAMRRARRVDVTVEGDVIHIDSHFQDSATTPLGPRSALHEYRVFATADLATGVLTSVAAEPRVLPFAECPLAADNVGRLIGTPLTDLRDVVLAQLRGTLGCTHLNDALRALAEVPVLAAALQPH